MQPTTTSGDSVNIIYISKHSALADLEGGRACHPLGDGLTPSLTVLLICDNGTALWQHHRHFCLFKHVKHGTQNIQNECHQWLCDSFRVHQIRFRPGRTPLGELTALPNAP